ncbi:hypothetical protein A2Z00_03625 [Candidatus Gottesmanbacteria bacterium RBG_13_45_10]|uniref:Uncharacterized protein n=1 Tax=Candidatus Gottesmanbacteria bacterium RBG_13_45_10 TaxID=1798370 RepID=A0A1F5ZGR9_9BACT|nr:MAG: hypothetical protein A2Z00_03625 [Candidatus Gottesmanbacteria bacterium RBG_13_45_10]
MKEQLTPKIVTHSLVHFLGVALIYVVTLFFPLWAVFLILIIHQIHMKMLGNCFLTRLAHAQGIMVGFSYWEYVPYLFGVKDWKKTGKNIDLFIKITLIGIVLIRLVALFLHR